MRIALCQMLSTGDKEVNASEIDALTARAVTAGAHLVVFPEFAMYDIPVMSEDYVAAAEDLDGPFASRVRALARKHEVTIAYGMVETADDSGKAYNSLHVVGPNGGTAATYRKEHLYDAFGFRESDFICAGPVGQAATFEVEGATVGMLLCYDLRFPEPARALATAGADIVIYPASWVPGPRKEDHWNTLVRARAIENTVFVAAVSQAPPLGTGSSLVVDPMGVVMGELGEAVDIVVRDIDPQRITDVRMSNPSLSNRRYGVAPSN